MNNEPVAYGRYIENAKMWLVVELDADMPEGYIPLYTHPVQKPIMVLDGNRVYPVVKELTDEEILREAYYILMREQQRKAQER